jgi:molecular chaperone GrpE (heat shock protein)
MSDANRPQLAKWPFYLGDLLLLAGAYYVYHQSKLPMTPGELAIGAGCIAVGAVLGALPAWAEFRAAVRLAETGELTNVVEQVRNMEKIAAQIAGATGAWNTAQESSDKTVKAAKDIAEKMALEVKGFAEFMQRTNDTEKANLRLEVEKLRRSEAEWLQVVVRTLDHVYALYVAALRSGQRNVSDQIGNFQNAVRDTARRIGLTAFIANPAERFDAQRHQLLDPKAVAPAEATVAETIAVGYTYQGRLIRHALVALNEGAPAANPDAGDDSAESPQSQLPLGSS